MGTRKTQDQTPDDYQDLSAGDEPAKVETTEQSPNKAAGPVLNTRRPFSMVWHNGLKAYLQDGVIFDRGSKEPIGKA